MILLALGIDAHALKPELGPPRVVIDGAGRILPHAVGWTDGQRATWVVLADREVTCEDARRLRPDGTVGTRALLRIAPSLSDPLEPPRRGMTWGTRLRGVAVFVDGAAITGVSEDLGSASVERARGMLSVRVDDLRELPDGIGFSHLTLRAAECPAVLADAVPAPLAGLSWTVAAEGWAPGIVEGERHAFAAAGARLVDRAGQTWLQVSTAALTCEDSLEPPNLAFESLADGELLMRGDALVRGIGGEGVRWTAGPTTNGRAQVSITGQATAYGMLTELAGTISARDCRVL